jgi:hypothetical protein
MNPQITQIQICVICGEEVFVSGLPNLELNRMQYRIVSSREVQVVNAAQSRRLQVEDVLAIVEPEVVIRIRLSGGNDVAVS